MGRQSCLISLSISNWTLYAPFRFPFGACGCVQQAGSWCNRSGVGTDGIKQRQRSMRAVSSTPPGCFQVALSHTEDVVSRTAEALKITPCATLSVQSHGLGGCRVITLTEAPNPLLVREKWSRSLQIRAERGSFNSHAMHGKDMPWSPCSTSLIPGAAGAIQAAGENPCCTIAPTSLAQSQGSSLTSWFHGFGFHDAMPPYIGGGFSS